MAKMKQVKVKQVSGMMNKNHDYLGKAKDGMAKGHNVLEKIPADQVAGEAVDKKKKMPQDGY